VHIVVDHFSSFPLVRDRPRTSPIFGSTRLPRLAVGVLRCLFVLFCWFCLWLSFLSVFGQGDHWITLKEELPLNETIRGGCASGWVTYPRKPLLIAKTVKTNPQKNSYTKTGKLYNKKKSRTPGHAWPPGSRHLPDSARDVDDLHTDAAVCRRGDPGRD
jgi:hypothetical protein